MMSLPVMAQDYFVDADGGNDAWNGLAPEPAANGEGPWKTLRKASLAKLLPGDTLSLRCDAIWHEPLVLIRSGTAGQPILVRSYGTNCRTAPRIDAAIPVQGWSLRPDGTWAAPLDFAPGAVFLNDAYLPPARYPRDADLHADGRDAAGRKLGPVPEGLAGRDLAQATITLRTQDWLIEERRLDGVSADGLVLEQPTRFPAGRDAPYYLSGKAWMLTYPDAWVFDGSDGQLLLRMPANVSVPQVEAARYDHALQIAGAEHVRIDGLRVSRSRTDGVLVSNSKAVELSNLEVADSGRDGVAISSSENVSVLHSTILRSRRDGISAVQSKAVTIRENLVAHSGVTEPHVNSLAAVNMEEATGILVQGNTIRNSGYIGIRFHRNARILDNAVEDSCQVLSDCGAIYAWSDNDPVPLASEVSGNRVAGTREDRSDTVYRPYNSGIYLDDLSSGVLVRNNRVSGCDSGVHIHNGFGLRIEANTLADNRRNQIYLSFGHPKRSGQDLAGNTIAGNSLTYGPTSLGVEIVSRDPDVRHADFDRNRYVDVGGRAVVFRTEKPGTETRPPRMYTLSRWQSLFGQDMAGSFESVPVPTSAMPPSRQRKLIGIDPRGWGVWSPDGSGTLAQRTACGGGQGGCLELRGGKTVALAISQPLQLTPDTACVVRLKLRSDEADVPVQVRMRGDRKPFADAGLFTRLLSDRVWSEYQLPFRVDKSARGRLELELKVNAGQATQISGTEVACG